MKNFLFVQHHPPHQNFIGQEALDAVLMGSAFVHCALLFMDDGVFQLLDNQNPDEVGRKNYPAGYAALKDYGVEKIYCSASSLGERNIGSEDIMVDYVSLSNKEITALFDFHDVILSF